MNWGVLGCASIAQRSVIPAILSIDENKLIAVSSRNRQLADEVGNKFNTEGVEGYENLLRRKDIDAVYIPLPNGLHYEWVCKALENNKHVLVEKSAFLNLEEAQSATDLARRKGLAIVENFQFQHHSQHRFVKEMLANDEIGEVRCFRSSFGFPPFDGDTNIRYKKDLGGGALLDSGAYVLKAGSFMFGNGFNVKASHLHIHHEYAVDWYGGGFLVDESSGIFSEVAFGFDNYYQCNYEIWGSKGKLTVTRAFTAKPDYAPIVIIEKNGVVTEKVMDADDHFRNMLVYFNHLIDNKETEIELENLQVQAQLMEDFRRLATKA